MVSSSPPTEGSAARHLSSLCSTTLLRHVMQDFPFATWTYLNLFYWDIDLDGAGWMPTDITALGVMLRDFSVVFSTSNTNLGACSIPWLESYLPRGRPLVASQPSPHNPSIHAHHPSIYLLPPSKVRVRTTTVKPTSPATPSSATSSPPVPLALTPTRSPPSPTVPCLQA